MTAETVNLLEDTYQPLAAKVSAAGPVIKGVKVLGMQSRNGREYPLPVMQKAKDLYEGVVVNIDHPKPQQEMRDFCERFGRIQNVRMGRDGLYADMVYNPAHPYAKAFDWWVKHDPQAVGLSHNATARIQRNREGKDEVTEILSVESVDLVADPATTKGLLESLKIIKEASAMRSQTAATVFLSRAAYNAAVPYSKTAMRLKDKAKRQDSLAGHYYQFSDPNDAKQFASETNGELRMRSQEAESEDTDMYGEDEKQPVLEEGPDGMADMLGDGDKAASAGDDWSKHLGQLILGILGDKGMDHGAKKAKIISALKLIEDDDPAMEPGMEPGAEEVTEEDEPSIYDSDDEAAQADDGASASDEDAGKAPADDDETMARKAEEALKRTGDRYYAALLRELDGYRVAEARRKLFKNAKSAADKAGLPSYAVTETFISTLATLPQGEWERVLEDRRRVSSKFSTPKSNSANAEDGLAALRKALREEI